MAITLDLPQDIESQLAEQWPDLPRKALEALAVQGYRQEVLTRRQVGELLGLDRWGVETFLAEHGAHRHYSVKDLKQDIETNRRLLGDAIAPSHE